MEILDVTRNEGRGSGFSVRDGDEEVATIRLGRGRSPASVTIEGKAYSVYRESRWRPLFLAGVTFALTGENGVLARAVKPNTFQRIFVIQFDGRQLALRPNHLVNTSGDLHTAYTTIYDLHEDSRWAGTFEPSVSGVRRSGCIAKLRSGMPLPLAVFVLCFVLPRVKQGELRSTDDHSEGGGPGQLPRPFRSEGWNR
jgi:hypothetical protein